MKRILLSVCFSLLAVVVYGAQYRVDISNPDINKEGDSLRITFDINASNFPKNSRVHLSPVVYNGDNQWSVLEPLVLVGKKRAVYDRRSGVSHNYSRVVDRNVNSVNYSVAIPYDHWMQYVSVAIEQVIEDCCTQFEIPLEKVAESQLLYYQPVPYFDINVLKYELTELEKYDLDNPFLHPVEDYEKRYDILLKDRAKNTSVLMFKVGSSQLDMNYNGNNEVLDAIRRALMIIDNDPNAKLKKIIVAGYASPEGSLAGNTALAKNRAAAVKRFLQTLLPKKSDHLFEIYNGREDWGGLREMVDNSSMAEKSEVLETIDAYTMEQEIRKTQLKQLNGGQPYRYMLENFYPTLRSAGYIQVYYDIDRRASVATAITDERGRTTWVDPDSPRNRTVTTVNTAMEYMVDENFAEALERLLPLKEDARTWNNIGVCYMMLGDYDNAEIYLEKALDNKDTNAQKNLDQISWARKVKN